MTTADGGRDLAPAKRRHLLALRRAGRHLIAGQVPGAGRPSSRVWEIMRVKRLTSRRGANSSPIPRRRARHWLLRRMGGHVAELTSSA
jgi:hypothetical protein